MKGAMASRAASLLCALAVAAACVWATPAFLAVGAPRSPPPPPQVRGVAGSSDSGVVRPAQGMAAPLVALSLATVAVVTAARRASRAPAPVPRVVARAEAEAEAEAEAPPPPPPFDPSKQLGAMAPLGFFDPAGFSKVGDKEGFCNLRSAEIKHGRVAMMAAVGALAQHFIKFPGFESVPAGLTAVTTAPGTYGFAALFLVSGALELGVWVEDPSKEPGNFGDPAGLGMYDDEMRCREINNGRFAMFAALGIISAELLTGKDAAQQFGL